MDLESAREKADGQVIREMETWLEKTCGQWRAGETVEAGGL